MGASASRQRGVAGDNEMKQLVNNQLQDVKLMKQEQAAVSIICEFDASMIRRALEAKIPDHGDIDRINKLAKELGIVEGSNHGISNDEGEYSCPLCFEFYEEGKYDRQPVTACVVCQKRVCRKCISTQIEAKYTKCSFCKEPINLKVVKAPCQMHGFPVSEELQRMREKAEEAREIVLKALELLRRGVRPALWLEDRANDLKDLFSDSVNDPKCEVTEERRNDALRHVNESLDSLTRQSKKMIFDAIVRRLRALQRHQEAQVMAKISDESKKKVTKVSRTANQFGLREAGAGSTVALACLSARSGMSIVPGKFLGVFEIYYAPAFIVYDLCINIKDLFYGELRHPMAYTELAVRSVESVSVWGTGSLAGFGGMKLGLFAGGAIGFASGGVALPIIMLGGALFVGLFGTIIGYFIGCGCRSVTGMDDDYILRAKATVIVLAFKHLKVHPVEGKLSQVNSQVRKLAAVYHSDVNPIGDNSDFLLLMHDAEMARVHLRERNKNKLENSLQQAVQEIYEVVEHMHYPQAYGELCKLYKVPSDVQKISSQ